MRFKSNVEVKTFQPDLWRGLFQLEDIHKRLVGQNLEMFVTSMNDSAHMAGSLHYKDLAADVRTHDLDSQTKHQWLEDAKAEMDGAYDIILEYEGRDDEHMHIEFDPHS